MGCLASTSFSRRGFDWAVSCKLNFVSYKVPLALAASAGALAWAVRGRSAAVFGDSVWHGPRDRRALALTFDDGPSESTPEILEILARHNVPATFFQVGQNVERLPEIARAVPQAGHQIGNHTYSHPMLCFRSPGFMAEELRRAQESIAEHTGVHPEWFRAPYGVRWFGLGGAQQKLGLTGVMWTVIGYDWSLKASEVVERVAQRVSNGAILCLHDGRELQARPDAGQTVEAVRSLVPMLLDRGYKLETVSRLLCPTN
jgi:peptidoglycan-N-acetylglucosamine deacetylase